MSGPAASSHAPFSRGGALALVGGGFALFLAMLWLIGAGSDFGGDRGAGQAHAAATGLNGYAGLARLIEADGYRIERSRSPEALRTHGLLILTPPPYADAKEIGEILEKRRFAGPTLVILSKWMARGPPPTLPPRERAKFKRGWVTLGEPMLSEWPAGLPSPYTFTQKLEEAAEGARPARWRGLGLAGSLPAPGTLHAEPAPGHEALITDEAGRVLAFAIHRDSPIGEDGYGLQPVIVLVDPDLANNYGLADPVRAAAAMALIDELTFGGKIAVVTFDMTLAGFGAAENLLTLAFRPPFLAATLTLLVALLIVGWRAFQRFGPTASARGPDIAFGKRQLIANGAGLILRARRFGLLARPYAALAARRLADRLGLVRPDAQAIDAALARRLPTEEPFTRRAARLEAAARPAEILAAARSLDELATRLQQGPTSR
jgi:hypothetical protein